jgi:deoxyribodipyrimidine photo-lyase
MRTLVWFRADLRAHDNRALAAACATSTRGVVAVFVICPRQWRNHDWADIKVAFLRRNLAALSQELAELNIPLLVRTAATFKHVPDTLRAVAEEHACDALLFNREYEVNETARDKRVTEIFEASGRGVLTFDDQTIIPPDALRTRQGGFYSIFSPFKRAWIEHLDDDPVCGVVDRVPRRLPELVTPPDAIPEAITGFDLDRDRADLWPAGEPAARERLDTFISARVARYKDLRDVPGVDGTSRLSPYLALGVLSPRQCLRAAVDANGGGLDRGAAGPLTWISELIWREFYRHVLVGFPHVCKHRPFRPAYDRVRWREAPTELDAWQAGRTGVPIVDAGMRQLAQAGWMHNRVRMVVAMFLSKDLLLDWRAGERHFMRQLVDGDLASNNGGWQWSASTGTDAAPYFRIFNPYTQGQRFDPDGDYIRRFVPELRDVPTRALHDPRALDDPMRRQADYPWPICDHRTARQRAIDAFEALKK